MSLRLNNLTTIAATEAMHAAKAGTDATSRLRLAMEHTKAHWLVTDDAERLRAAVCAAIAACQEAEDEWAVAQIEQSWQALRTLDAAMSGVPVKFEALDTDGLIAILPMWQEIKAGDPHA